MREQPHDLQPQAMITQLREHAEELFGGRGIDAAYLYGSVAAGRPHPFSDVDIALLLREDKFQALTPYERLKLELELEVVIQDQCDVPNPDVRTINDAPLVFRGAVACQGVRLYSNNEAHRIAFETRTWKEFFDYQPTLRMMERAFLARLRREGLGGRTRQAQRDVRHSGWNRRQAEDPPDLSTR